MTSTVQLRRYSEIARLLVRNRSSLRLVGEEAAASPDDPDLVREGERLASDLEDMGPTFVKLGQLLSTRADLLPPSHLASLSRLQDDVSPFPAEQAREIFRDEVGADVDDVFSEFEDEPVASASLGQVHRARLRDGRRVVVKVQRPGSDVQVTRDLEVLGEIAQVLDNHTDAGRRYGFGDLLEQFRRSLLDEVDYRHEASNLLRLGELLNSSGTIFVPRPFADLSGRRVLVMDEVEGRKVTELGRFGRLEVDGTRLADALTRAYLEQIFVHGFFHADPHPGNVLLMPDGRIGLVDLGMVGHLRSDVRMQLVKLLLAIEEGRGEDAAEVLVRLGRPLDDFDEARVLRDVADLVARRHGMSLAELRVGDLLTELSQACGAAGLRPAPELALLARALLNLDGVTRSLDEDFEPAEAIRAHSAEILSSQMTTTGGSVLSTLVEAKDFVEQLPGRVNRIMEAVAHGELRVNVKAFDEAEMLTSLTKVANRLAMGLVISALLLGAAIMTRSYPQVALAFFLVAAACGLGLIVSVVASDRHVKSRAKRGRRV